MDVKLEYRKTYLHSPHWYRLNDQLIDSNPDASCWICGKLSTLLLHHITYENLYKEELYKDVYILCFDCHTRVHFKPVLYFFRRKTPLEKHLLLRRMRFLKMISCIQKGRIFPSLWYMCRYLTF